MISFKCISYGGFYITYCCCIHKVSSFVHLV